MQRTKNSFTLKMIVCHMLPVSSVRSMLFWQPFKCLLYYNYRALCYLKTNRLVDCCSYYYYRNCERGGSIGRLKKPMEWNRLVAKLPQFNMTACEAAGTDQ